MCKKWVHLKCTKFSNDDYIASHHNPVDWFCSPCLQTIFPFNKIEDNTEFLFAVQDCSSLNSCYDSFKDLVFNLYVLTSSLANSLDLDPDNQFYAGNSNINPDSAYFSEDKFKMKFSLNPNTFSLINFHACSLPHNFDKFC